MILESNHGPGDTVYRLRLNKSQYRKPCALCGRSGQCTLVENGKKVRCPECRGDGEIAQEAIETCEIEKFEIGSVQIQWRDGFAVVTYYTGKDCQGTYAYEESEGLRPHEAMWPVYGSIAEAKGAMEDKGYFTKEELLKMREFLDELADA